jgi:two-component system sensor histidine kinase YesM
LMSRPGETRAWYVVDRDRSVLSATDPLAVGATLPPVAFPGEGSPGSFLSTADDRARWLVSWRTIRNDEWTVVTVEPYESIIRELYRIRWKLFWVNLASALAFVAVAALIARSITRPIRVLADNMRNLESELTRADGPRVARFDEIGALERSYDAMRRRLARLMRQIEEKERKKREAELEALQLQVSPHFLFNTLSSIRWAILNRNNTKAAGMIFALGNLLRMSLLKTNEFITVDQELENLAHYLDIVRLRRAVSFEVRYTVEETTRQELIPRLILQPLVENAVIHGLDPDRTDGLIEIETSRNERHLHFAIRDNGRGTRVEPRPKRARGAKLSGIGLRNVRERIRLIYGSGYIVRRSGIPGKGTTVSFRIPILSRRPPA